MNWDERWHREYERKRAQAIGNCEPVTIKGGAVVRKATDERPTPPPSTSGGVEATRGATIGSSLSAVTPGPLNDAQSPALGVGLTTHGSQVRIGQAGIKPGPLTSVPAGEPYPNLLVIFAERGIYPPVREYPFAAPDRRFRFDYAWPTAGKVALEVDGGVWRKGGGAHSHPSNILRDIEKHNAATLLGWRVIRATPDRLAEAVDQVAMLLAGEAA